MRAPAYARPVRQWQQLSGAWHNHPNGMHVAVAVRADETTPCFHAPGGVFVGRSVHSPMGARLSFAELWYAETHADRPNSSAHIALTVAGRECWHLFALCLNSSRAGVLAPSALWR